MEMPGRELGDLDERYSQRAAGQHSERCPPRQSQRAVTASIPLLGRPGRAQHVSTGTLI